MQSVLVLGLLAVAGGEKTVGFAPLEIYKADGSACCLAAIDVDGDGLNDVAYVDNAQAVIQFLVQKSAEELARDLSLPPEYDPRKPNDVPSDRRFRRASYLTEKKVFSWDFVDLTGDGRGDLVFYGDPRELVVVAGEPNGEWAAEPQTWRVAEGVASTQALATGDFDGDGRTDVALLGKDETTFWYGTEGGLGEPVEVPNTVRGAYGIVAGDYDGNGLVDLLYVGPGDVPFHVRFQRGAGLGPTYGFKLPGPRDWAVDDVDRDGSADIVYVDDVTGRLKLHGFERRATQGHSGLGGARVFPLAADDAAKTRRHAVADIDGDGRADVLVTEPGAARVLVMLQGDDGITTSRRFPTLSKVTALAVADADGDGSPEVLVLSPEERSLGVSRWTGHGLDFPEAIAVAGKPSAFAVADLDGDGSPDLALVTKDGKQQRLLIDVRGPARARESGVEPDAEGVLALELLDVKDEPDALVLFDVDRDGRKDVLLVFDYEPLKVFLNRAGAQGELTLLDVSTGTSFGRGLVEKALPVSFQAADYDLDGVEELLLSKENFARAIAIDDERVVVMDQFSARSPRAQIAGVAAIDLDDDPRPEIVLYDKKANELSVLDLGDDGYAVVDTIDVPALSFRGLSVADLDGDGRDDLLLVGEDRLVALFVGGERWTLAARSSYVTDVKDGRLNRVAVGDLDGGALEVFVVDTREQELKILGLEDGELSQRTSFRVFEAKAFQRQVTLDEPREIVVADVTGDGLPDIVSLTHDRVLVYPREGDAR